MAKRWDVNEESVPGPMSTQLETSGTIVTMALAFDTKLWTLPELKAVFHIEPVTCVCCMVIQLSDTIGKMACDNFPPNFKFQGEKNV